MKIFNRKKDRKQYKILAALSIFFIFLIVLIFIAILIEAKNNTNIKVTTDKNRYREGQNIIITINNNKEVPISYKNVIDRAWDIQILNEGEWNSSSEIIFGEKGKYFLVKKLEGNNNTCRISSDTPNLVATLQPEEEIKFEWDQNGCLATSREMETFIKRAKKGTYRIVFNFSYKGTDEHNKEIILNEKTFSQPFKIK